VNLIAVLTGAVRRSGKRSLNDRCAVSGQAPCSGARRRGKALDEVSTAIPGGAAARNALHNRMAMKRSVIASPSLCVC